jgi:Protein of unknown function (DUF2934)
MSGAQTRSQKGKATPKMTGRGVPVTVKSKHGNSEIRPGSGPAFSAQERERLVAQAAYFRAEKRGFVPGCELQDWIEAEAEVLRLIGNA